MLDTGLFSDSSNEITHIRTRVDPVPADEAEAQAASWLGNRRPTLGFTINGDAHEVDYCLPDPRIFRSIVAGSDTVRRAGGFSAELERRSAASAVMMFSGVQEPERKHQLVSSLTATLLQVALDSLDKRQLPLACFPCLAVRTNQKHQVLVQLYAADDEHQEVIARLAMALYRPLKQLIQPATSPTLLLGARAFHEIQIRCELPVRESYLELAAGAGTNPEQTNALSRELRLGEHEPDKAALDNDRVLAAASAVGLGLGLAVPSLTETWLSHATRWGSIEPLVAWDCRHGALVGELKAPEPWLRGPESAPSDPVLTAQRLVLTACAGLAASVAALKAPAAAPRQRYALPPPRRHAVRLAS
jgi:hypothetical protein